MENDKYELLVELVKELLASDNEAAMRRNKAIKLYELQEATRQKAELPTAKEPEATKA